MDITAIRRPYSFAPSAFSAVRSLGTLCGEMIYPRPCNNNVAIKVWAKVSVALAGAGSSPVTTCPRTGNRARKASLTRWSEGS